MNSLLLLVPLILLLIVVLVLCYMVFDMRKRLKTMLVLDNKDQSKSFTDLFNQYIERLDINSKDLVSINKKIEKIEQELHLSIKDVQIIRFNPFLDTGSDQSFVVGFLDSNKSGILITCLNSRAQSRIYSKKVIMGKCDVNLSDEEKKLLAM